MRFVGIALVLALSATPALAFDDPGPSPFVEFKRDRFNYWDDDGGGSWDTREFMNWAVLEGGMNEVQAANSFDNYDANGDGGVDFNEYLNYGVWT